MKVPNRIAAVLALGLASLPAVAAAASRDGRAVDATFRPELYFAGATRSTGVETDAFGSPIDRINGRPRGRRERDGSTVLDQTIRFGDGTIRERRWRMNRTGPDAIEVTGTDVVGVAHGRVEGRTLRLVSIIRWRADDLGSDLGFAQTMTLQPDGRTLTIRSAVTKFGLPVRSVEERFLRQ